MVGRIKAGDVVKLNSGGPNMTVVDSVEAGPIGRYSVYVLWFDDNEKLCNGYFTDESLKKVKP